MDWIYCLTIFTMSQHGQVDAGGEDEDEAAPDGPRLGVNFHQFAIGMWQGYGLPFFFHAFQVKFDGLMDEIHDFRAAFSDSNASWKIRYIGTIA